ncbi:MAG: chalcone isomerase family protein [Bdellovibrionales bacterium]|nr:chalcone isomerase family protein [Bdellovibrionales bacterium]
MLRFLSVIFLATVITLPAQADLLCGGDTIFEGHASVQMEDKSIRSLILNGVGKKRYLFFDVLFAALYVETPSEDGPAIIEAVDEVKIMVIHALVKAKKNQLVDAWNSEFDRLCEDQCDELRPFHEQFISYADDVNKKERLIVTFKSDRVELETSRGDVFDPVMSGEYGRLMLRSSIGEEPNDDVVKKGMLGDYDKYCDEY